MISLIESGERATTTEVVERWASACNARLVLVRGGEDLAALEEEEQAIVQAWRRLRADPGRQAVLFDVARVLEALEPQSLAMLAALLQAAGAKESSALPESERRVG